MEGCSGGPEAEGSAVEGMSMALQLGQVCKQGAGLGGPWVRAMAKSCSFSCSSGEAEEQLRGGRRAAHVAAAQPAQACTTLEKLLLKQRLR